MSTATTLNESRYRLLLRKTMPMVIKTEAEYRRIMAIIKHLMDKEEHEVTDEEGRILELLAMLAEEYEDRKHPLPTGEPYKMLAHLLNENGLRPSHLWAILPKSRVSEILRGKRSISKAQARKLSEFFGVPADLFL